MKGKSMLFYRKISNIPNMNISSVMKLLQEVVIINLAGLSLMNILFNSYGFIMENI